MNNPLDITWKFLTKNLFPILQISFALGVLYYIIDKLLGLLYPYNLNFNFFYQQFTSLLTVPIQFDTVHYGWQFWLTLFVTLLVVSGIMTLMLKMVSIFINIVTVSNKNSNFQWSFTFRAFLHFVARLVKQPSTAHSVSTTNTADTSSQNQTSTANSNDNGLELTTGQRLKTLLAERFLMLLVTIYIVGSSLVLSMPFYGYLQHVVNGELSIAIIATVIVWVFVMTFNLSFLLPTVALVMYAKYKGPVKFLATSFLIFRQFWYNSWVFTILILCYVILAQLAAHYIHLFADQVRLGLLGDLIVYALFVVKYFAIVAFSLAVCMCYITAPEQTRETREAIFVDRPYVPARKILQNIFSSMINALKKNNSYKPKAKTNKLTHYQIINSDQSNLALHAWHEDQEYFSDNDAAHNSSPLAEPSAHSHTASPPVSPTSKTTATATTVARKSTNGNAVATSKSSGTASKQPTTGNQASTTASSNKQANPSLSLDQDVATAPATASNSTSNSATTSNNSTATTSKVSDKAKAALGGAGHLVSNLTAKTKPLVQKSAATGKNLGKLCSKLFGRNKKTNEEYAVVGDIIQFNSDAIPDQVLEAASKPATPSFDAQNDLATPVTPHPAQHTNSANIATATSSKAPKSNSTSSTQPSVSSAPTHAENLDPTKAFATVKQQMQQGNLTKTPRAVQPTVNSRPQGTLEADVVPIPTFDPSKVKYMGKSK